ncbi:glucokinase [Thiohalocapsa marina]|uniref:Glucokinase n=1 Tax=Thiohalocapsa marina TaxID=424902 RepID=A0A5M8FMN4_9GAMM|nr:glucokinase [Thiohalocapsa marina]KAA6184411.1 glucokinase [Thiohalocapsa marina]
MALLVGDIGGTKTVLALAHFEHRQVRLSDECRYASEAFDGLEAVIARFVEESGARFDGAGLAVAGPVVDDRCLATNLPWELDARRVSECFRLRRAWLLNDLEAVAWGIPALEPSQLAELQPGRQTPGNACVVAAGTGLGQAGLFWDGRMHHPFATEGGHCDFAPADAREAALLAYLQPRLGGHVSWERLVSGMGIGHLYDFLRQCHGGAHAPAVARAIDEDGDLAAAVADTAAAGACPVCVEAMDLFASLYGREAGNAALKHMALGGVYLGGGIAPRHLHLLRGGSFLRGFLHKGRMGPLMQQMPVRVILEHRAPLFGAARYVAQAAARH